MKITFVLKTIPRTIGGGTLVIFEYANYLASQNHDVEVLVADPDMWSRAHLPEFIRKVLVKQSIRKRPSWFDLNKKIKKYVVFECSDSNVHDAEIIVATAVDTAKIVATLSNLKGKKIYFIQGYENWVLSDNEVQDTYRLGLINITVSNWLTGIVDKYSRSKSICVKNGINTSVFYVSKKPQDRKLHSIVFQYRSNEAKGCNYAIEVSKRIKERYSDTEINVISNEKKPRELPDYFKYYRNISPKEVAMINNDSTIFICTSVAEGFGLPGLEAMACGCAIVSSAYTGVYEYAIDGENALLSPVRDVESMVKNIVRLFNDDALRKKISENGIKTGKERSIEKSAKKFEDILLKTIR